MKHLYEIAFEGWKDDSARFWNVFYVMSVINGGLFALTMGHASGRDRLMIAVLGSALCLVWVLMQERFAHWIGIWDAKLSELEPSFLEELNAARANVGLRPVDVTVFAGRKPLARVPGGKRWPGVSTRRAGVVLPFVFFVGWLVAIWFR